MSLGIHQLQPRCAFMVQGPSWPTPPSTPSLIFMVWSQILLRVAAGWDHHIWCSAWGRLGDCHVPAILWRSTSASREEWVFSHLHLLMRSCLHDFILEGYLSEYLFPNTGWGSYLFKPESSISPIKIKEVFSRKWSVSRKLIQWLQIN